MMHEEENSKEAVKITVDVQHRLELALENESPRGMVLLSLSWIDHMLERKLAAEFCRGSRKERESLFTVGGPFHGLSAKMQIAYCAGWIGDDLYHDLKILRGIRNNLAHRIEACSSNANEIREKLEQLRSPHEIYSDWMMVRVAEIPDGIILYSGEKPEQAGEELSLPGTFALKFGIPAVVGVLGKSLNVELESSESENHLPVSDDGETAP